MTAKQVLTVKCPTCKHNVAWTDAEPFKPFCSERCKMIDLGDWATEAHKIPCEPLDENSEADDF
jgi:uncharacterized protein